MSIVLFVHVSGAIGVLLQIIRLGLVLLSLETGEAAEYEETGESAESK